MSKKFTAGQRVVFNQQYVANRARTYKAGETGTVIRDQDGGTVGVRMDDGTLTYAFAYRLDEVPEHPFKAGDVVTPNDKEHDMRSFTKGKPYKVREYRPAHDGACGVLYFESDDQGCTGRFRPASYYAPYVEETHPEPASEFRIRKHGTALREVRGIPFESQEAAEQAVSRYTPGSVYEIVEVKVVRTVKVEQEVRVIDYKEAA
ncbi:hypothetical protein [Burkholderia diffusa]|uniref:hypothetical protein n=1 Tax=Burkholderia diffusa TaxID=488732 RepID=UPI00157A35FF|nr:hypothetical protein [Burkholderia diffusa]NTY35795.1 hypothetical protein [Burkholderia diffusa]